MVLPFSAFTMYLQIASLCLSFVTTETIDCTWYLSKMKNQHGHWECWMSAMRRTHTCTYVKDKVYLTSVPISADSNHRRDNGLSSTKTDMRGEEAQSTTLARGPPDFSSRCSCCFRQSCPVICTLTPPPDLSSRCSCTQYCPN